MHRLSSRSLSAAIALAIFLTRGAVAQAGPIDAEMIRAARLAQNQAIAASAWDSVASFWVPDIAVVAGLGVPLQGRDAYRAGFAADKGMVYDRVPATILVSANWPLGYEEGTWSGHAPAAGSTPVISGRYTAQWVKVRGRWLIRSELFVALACSGAACRWPIAQSLR